MGSLLPTLAIALLLSAPAQASGPVYPDLDEGELARLERGKPVLRTTADGDEDGDESVLGLQRIDARSLDVWAILLDLARLTECSDTLVVAEEYTAEMDREPPPGARFIDFHYEMRIAGSSYEYNLHHTYYPAEGYLVWVLDEAKDNDVEWIEGSFSVWPVPGEPDRSDFLYTNAVRTGRRLPRWIEILLTKTALKQYLVFVREQAES